MISRKSMDLSEYSDTHGTTKRIKREQWGWSDLGDKPTLRWINKRELKIPEEYQRDRKSQNAVLKIAREFQWAKFCPIAVSEDKEGTLWVNDGGHRLRAALLRDDLQMLPCAVTKGLSLSEEAAIFADSAKCRNMISTHDKFIAQVVANDASALKVKAIIEKHGYHAIKHQCRYGFKPLLSLFAMVEEDAILADIVFGFCADMAEDGEQISGILLKALFYLQQHIANQTDILSGKYAERMARLGLKGLVVMMNRNRLITGNGGVKASAYSILQLINKGCTNKLTMD